VWTDVIQFAILFIGGIVALVAVFLAVPGGVPEVIDVADAAKKFRVFDLSTDPTIPFTLWCGVFGTTFLTLGSHGTDQMMAQRLFCCRDERGARKAVIWSSVGVLLSLMMITVGMGLFAYFKRFPLEAADAAKVKDHVDYIFPIFILRALPVGVKGLLFAAIFAAATATSTLSAMGQTALMSFYRPLLKREPSERHLLLVSRILILLAAIVLCGSAVMCTQIRQYPDILNLALAMAAYTYGPVLGVFLLALLPINRDARGLLWAVPVAVLFIFAITWHHHSWARIAAIAGAAAVAARAVPWLRGEWPKHLWVFAGAALVLGAAIGMLPSGGLWRPVDLAFPWLYPIGTVLTLGLGYLLGRPRARAAHA
jgi:Na+/proline symporter